MFEGLSERALVPRRTRPTSCVSEVATGERCRRDPAAGPPSAASEAAPLDRRGGSFVRGGRGSNGLSMVDRGGSALSVAACLPGLLSAESASSSSIASSELVVGVDTAEMPRRLPVPGVASREGWSGSSSPLRLARSMILMFWARSRVMSAGLGAAEVESMIPRPCSSPPPPAGRARANPLCEDADKPVSCHSGSFSIAPDLARMFSLLTMTSTS